MNRNAIPDTLTMNSLESRLLSSSRYPGLNMHINDGSGGWDDDVEYGYRLSVTQDNEIFDVIQSVWEKVQSASMQRNLGRMVITEITMLFVLWTPRTLDF